jgi:hypothetical protein
MTATSSPPHSPSLARAREAWPLPRAAPEELGFSPPGLERLHEALDRTVDDGSHAGYVLLLARSGRIVDWRAHGYRNAVTREPLVEDDVFRIFSMTKLFTSAAVLMLLGCWPEAPPRRRSWSTRKRAVDDSRPADAYLRVHLRTTTLRPRSCRRGSARTSSGR